jgi:predicted  nucleic acid-binding Zn-ribbon protein
VANEVGGKRLAEDLKVRLPDLRKVADDLRLRAAAAVTQFTAEAKNVEAAIKSIEDEAAAMASVANEILGNVPPAHEGS